MTLKDFDLDLKTDIAIEYPRFLKSTKSLLASNYHICELVSQEFHEFKSRMADYHAYREAFGAPFLSGSFAIRVLTDKFMSLEFGFSSYLGGAHGGHWKAAVNLFLDLFGKCEITDLFCEREKDLPFLSDICVKDLLSRQFEGQKLLHEEDVCPGAAPLPHNYKCFSVSPEELVITFGEYQVGPYAVGAQTVQIPLGALGDKLSGRARAALCL